MYGDNHLGAVTLEQLPHVTRRQPIEEVRLVGAEALNRRVVILHQRLMVAEQIVVKLCRFLREEVRLFDGTNDVDQAVRSGETFQSIGDGRGGAGVTAAGI